MKSCILYAIHPDNVRVENRNVSNLTSTAVLKCNLGKVLCVVIIIKKSIQKIIKINVR
jgi:hypothetical protein